jgi:hypothetical protein
MKTTLLPFLARPAIPAAQTQAPAQQQQEVAVTATELGAQRL